MYHRRRQSVAVPFGNECLGGGFRKGLVLFGGKFNLSGSGWRMSEYESDCPGPESTNFLGVGVIERNILCSSGLTLDGTCTSCSYSAFWRVCFFFLPFMFAARGFAHLLHLSYGGTLLSLL